MSPLRVPPRVYWFPFPDSPLSLHSYHFTLEKEMSGGTPHEWIEDIQKVCDRLVLNTIGGEKKGNLLDRSYSMVGWPSFS